MYAGTVNCGGGYLEVLCSKLSSDSTVAKMVALVEQVGLFSLCNRSLLNVRILMVALVEQVGLFSLCNRSLLTRPHTHGGSGGAGAPRVVAHRAARQKGGQVLHPSGCWPRLTFRHGSVGVGAGDRGGMYPPPHMTCMYPPPHMTCMYPPPHMTCMYPPPHMTCIH